MKAKKKVCNGCIYNYQRHVRKVSNFYRWISELPFGWGERYDPRPYFLQEISYVVKRSKLVKKGIERLLLEAQSTDDYEPWRWV